MHTLVAEASSRIERDNPHVRPVEPDRLALHRHYALAGSAAIVPFGSWGDHQPAGGLTPVDGCGAGGVRLFAAMHTGRPDGRSQAERRTMPVTRTLRRRTESAPERWRFRARPYCFRQRPGP